MDRILRIGFGLIVLGMTGNALAADWFVAPSGAQFSSIQAAVDAAGPGDMIKVARGTYGDIHTRPAPAGYPGPANVTQVVLIDKALTVRGGYDAAFTEPPDPATYPVVLEAVGQGRVILVKASGTVVIEGLSIISGRADGLGGASWGDAGGGICAVTTTVGIHICEIAFCSGASGGGVFLNACSDVEMTANRLFENEAADSGGGLYAHNTSGTFAFNEFSNNSAGRFGGGMWSAYSAPVFLMDAFRGNHAGMTGGGMVLYDSSGLVTGCRLQDNSAQQGGGAWSVFGAEIWVGDMVTGNSASVAAAGLLLEGVEARLESVLIAGNSLSDESASGAGLTVSGGTPCVAHLTLVSNTGGDGVGIHATSYEGSPAHLAMWNTIIAGQTTGIQVRTGSTAVLEATLWSGNLADTAGPGSIDLGSLNYTGDPLFVDPAGEDFHIQYGSPAIDRGVDTGASADIDGEERWYGVAPDLGADEYRPSIELGVRFDMPDNVVTPGSTFYLTALLDNPGPPLMLVPLAVVLDVYGDFWFWPSWSHYSASQGTGFDMQFVNVPVGTTSIQIFAPLTWPDTGDDRVTGLWFYGAMLTPELDAVRGRLGSREWSYVPPH